MQSPELAEDIFIAKRSKWKSSLFLLGGLDFVIFCLSIITHQFGEPELKPLIAVYAGVIFFGFVAFSMPVNFLSWAMKWSLTAKGSIGAAGTIVKSNGQRWSITRR